MSNTTTLHMQSQAPKNKFNDPARHAAERLAAFLSSITQQLPDAKHPDRATIKKPKKLLKALLPWLQKRQQASKTRPMQQQLAQLALPESNSSQQTLAATHYPFVHQY